MSLGDLKRLIRTGEGTFLEFKRTISSPERIAREVCAFANTRGGTLLIGVNDDRSLVGVRSFYEESYLLYEALNMLCSPAIDYEVEIVQLGDKDIVVVKVMESENKPVYAKLGKKSHIFVREKDKSVRPTKERAALNRFTPSLERKAISLFAKRTKACGQPKSGLPCFVPNPATMASLLNTDPTSSVYSVTWASTTRLL